MYFNSLWAFLPDKSWFNNCPLGTGRKLNVHKISRTSSERLMLVQFRFCVYRVVDIIGLTMKTPLQEALDY